MELTFLGTGTSHGIPVIACDCVNCNSLTPENNRLRSSVLIKNRETSILIDTTPEFRIQALREKINNIDAVLYTHTHADHLHGIDDLRPFSMNKSIPLYGLKEQLQEIEDRFPYIFNSTIQKGGGKPNLYTTPINKTVVIGKFTITPIPVKHGLIDILGYRINNIAYITDCSKIPDESYDLLKNLDILVIGALRFREHSTHFTIEQAIDEIEKISPKKAYFTHLCHDVDHFELIEYLNKKGLEREFIKKIKPAHDGLCLKTD